jgi:hydroxymethylbilane synthase
MLSLRVHRIVYRTLDSLAKRFSELLRKTLLMIRIGTRGSALALWQANWVKEQLERTTPGLPVEIVVIQTEGDASQVMNTPLSEIRGRGVFVTELETALRDGRIDVAVHSAKDMTSPPLGIATPDLLIAAYCERADPRDALVSPRFGTLEKLPHGARVATGSPRRIAQLRNTRPDLQFVEIRGNVDTRLKKLENGEADALVLAVAGLTRLNRESAITETLEPEVMLPQVGQGCVAAQCRAGDNDIIATVARACDHFLTRREVSCERAFLSKIGGGCTAPVAGYAISSDRMLYLFALIATPDGQILRTRAGAAITLGENLIPSIAEGAYQDLIKQGAVV